MLQYFRSPQFRTIAIILLSVIITVAVVVVLRVTGNEPDPSELIDRFDGITEETTSTYSYFKDPMFLGGIFFFILFVGGTLYTLFVYIPFDLWLRAKMSGVKIKITDVAIMKYKTVPPEEILTHMIRAKEAGLDLPQSELVRTVLAGARVDKVANAMITSFNAGYRVQVNDLVSNYLAKVDIEQVIAALVKAKNAGLEISMNELSQHYLAKVNIMELITAAIMAKEGKLPATLQLLVSHSLAGGNMIRTIQAVISANNADAELEQKDKLMLNFVVAANIDLAGMDVLQAVNEAINFKVIETSGVTSVALDGVQLTMRVKVTIRPKIRKIIRGAGEDTLIARVNENLVSVVGSTESHYDILKNPYKIADKVEEKSFLFDDTAYEVKSIDISNIEVGKDIHAELEIERSKAAAERAKAEVIKAEEEVQKAMADAFREGNFSIDEYHKMKNMRADTGMRESFINKPPETQHGH